MMKPILPQVGSTYVSAVDPNICLFVESVQIIKADEYGTATYYVEACEPGHTRDASRSVIELTEDEWAEHGFTIKTEKAGL
jgi:hypothetical protein